MVGLTGEKEAGQGTGGDEAAEKVIRVPLAKHQNTESGIISMEMGSLGGQCRQQLVHQASVLASLPNVTRTRGQRG